MLYQKRILICCALLCLFSFPMQANGQPYPYGGQPRGPYGDQPPGPYGGRPPHPHREQVIFNNGNIDGVQNGPSRRTKFFIDRPYHITFIQNYHYYNNGNPPGYIALVSSNGTRFGPWPAVGNEGQGGVPKAYWNCYPNVTIPPGAYVVEDSDPATWSQNAASEFRGISLVKGKPVY